MNKGVSFDGLHTSTFGIFLSKVKVGDAAVKENKIDIPGASGSLDMTDFFDGVCYENREIVFEFTLPQRNNELLTAYSNIQTALHGKHFDSIILDDDKNYRYIGRASVGELEKKVISKVKITCDCVPFKYSIVPNIVSFPVTEPEYPTGWLYGDVNGDGVFDERDNVAVTVLEGKRTFESEAALRADFNFNGVVDSLDVYISNTYLTGCQNKAEISFKDFSISKVEFFNSLRNCKRITMDFGPVATPVKFKRVSSTGTFFWDLSIDNISQFGLHGEQEFTVNLKGIHEVMISTANTDTTGVFSITWYCAGTL